MVERYIKTVEEQLQAIASNEKDWDAMLPLFLLAYRASTYNIHRFHPSKLVIRKRTPTAQRSTVWDTSLAERPTIAHARQHLRLASNRMKTWYDNLANCPGYHEGERVWLYRPTRTKGRSPKIQSSCEGHTR
jgi:hypothetical protein